MCHTNKTLKYQRMINIYARSSEDRAVVSEAEGRGFNSLRAYQIVPKGRILWSIKLQ